MTNTESTDTADTTLTADPSPRNPRVEHIHDQHHNLIALLCHEEEGWEATYQLPDGRKTTLPAENDHDTALAKLTDAYRDAITHYTPANDGKTRWMFED